MRLESVDISKGIVNLRGIDLIDGTPVVDIKPYVPHVDQPTNNFKVLIPNWITNPKFSQVPVYFTKEVELELHEIVKSGSSQWFGKDEVDELIEAIKQIITLDPRGVIHGRGFFNVDSTDSQNESEKLQNQTKVDPQYSQVDNKFIHQTKHLHRNKFVLEFDSFRAWFSPHQTDRAFVVHSIERFMNK